MKTFIYVLICPLSNQIRYVGKSNDPERRRKDHSRDFRVRINETEKPRWLKSLSKKGLKPEIEIVDEVDINEWKYWEAWWINYFRSIGCNLLNTASGGNGLTVGNNFTFKKGNIPWNKGLKM